MLKHKKKIAGLVAVAAVALPVTVMAGSTTIGATAEFLTAISFVNETDMDFGKLEFSGAPTGADTVTLGTNGTIAYAGSIFSGPTSGTPGSVEVATGDAGATVDVYCSLTALLAETGGGTIQLNNIKATLSSAPAAPGAGGSCNNTTTPAIGSHTLAIGDVFLFGGRLDGGNVSAFVAGAYDTATGAGVPITIDVLYQ